MTEQEEKRTEQPEKDDKQGQNRYVMWLFIIGIALGLATRCAGAG